MKSILFVCAGNTCRSPMAEALLRQILKTKGIDHDFEVFSAGVNPTESVADYTSTILWKEKLECKKKANKIDEPIINEKEWDLVIVLDKNIEENTIKEKLKTNLIKEIPIEDPYPGELSDYDKCYKDIKEELFSNFDLLMKEVGYECE